MEDKKKIPHYNIVMNDEYGSGLEFVSFVSDPAIMEMGLAFSKASNFKFNKEKQVVVGPAMIPDLPLYRNQGGEEFFVVFTKDVIEKLSEKFNKEPREYKINVDHDGIVESAFIKSNWIIEDKDNDKSNMYGFNLPVGTWMLEVKVEDAEFWQQEIKDQGKFGFSVEGLFGLEFVGEFNNNKINNTEMKIEELSAEEKALIEKFRAEQADKMAEVAIEEEKEEEKEVVTAEEEEKPEVEVEEVEEVPTAEAAGIDEEAVMALIQPKLDELTAMIAEVKSMMDSKEAEPEANAGGEAPIEMSRVANILAFRNKFAD